MILLQVNQLSKSFGVEPILENIKLEVQERDRIALVGRNGAGKSTLLKIIAGELSHDSGDIMKGKDVKIGYLAQDSGLESNETIAPPQTHSRRLFDDPARIVAERVVEH